MFRPRVFCLLVVSACIALAAPFAQAGPPPPPTNILFGFISANRTLTFAPPGPIYNVVGDLVVMPGITLTVEPGVTLKMALTDTLQVGDFPSKVELDVFGTLSADASTGDSIRFVSAGGGGTAEWGQVHVEAGGTATIRRAFMRGATIALNGAGGSTLNFSDAGVTACGSVLSAFGNVGVGRVLATSCDAGIDVTYAAGLVRECTLAGNGIGAGLILGAGVSTTPFDTTDVTPIIVSNFYYGVLL